MNFLQVSEPEAAELDAQSAAIADKQRLQDQSSNALVQQYGPAAADPTMWNTAVTADVNSRTADDKVNATHLDMDQAKRADEAAQAQHAIAFIRQQMASGVDAPTALGNLTPETYSALGVSPDQVGPLVSAVKANPHLLDQIGEALAPIAAGSKMVGSVQWAKAPDGKYHAMYPMQDAQGRMTYQEPGKLPDGYSLLGETPGQADATSVKAGIMPGSTGAPADAGTRLKAAIIGQESGGNPGVGTSVDGAHGIGQITVPTFNKWAKPGEKIDNPADNAAVSGRILDSYMQEYGDPARAAVAYFSGPGNVAPADSATPYLHDTHDGNGVYTSAYVKQVLGRMGSSDDSGGAQLTPVAKIKQQQADVAQARLALAAQHEARVASGTDGGQLSTQATDYLAQQYRTTGKLPAMGMGGAATRAQIFNRAAEMAAASGASGESDVLKAQATHERATAVNDLGKSTPNSAGGRVQSANALVTHLDQLNGLSTALTSGNLPIINKAKQAYMQATGSPAPTNFNAVKTIAADEASKFIVGGNFTQSDRDQAKRAFDGAQSPAQLAQAIQQVQHLAAGQLGGMRQRYQAIGATNEFDGALTPRARQLLGGGQAAAGGGGQAAPANTAALRAKYGL